MAENKKYKVIVSERAKRMLGMHIRFMAQVDKDAAAAKKKEIVAAMRSLSQMPQRFPFFEEMYFTPNNTIKCLLRDGISSSTKSKMIRSMSIISSIVVRITVGL